MASPTVRPPLICHSSPTFQDESICSSRIVLQYMPKQNVIRGPEDDWSGLSSAAERRRAQNRLHQRAWRKRKALLRSQAHTESSTISHSHATIEGFNSPSSEENSSLEGSNSLELERWQEISLFQIFNAAAGLCRIKDSERAQTAAACRQDDLDDRKSINLLRKWAQSRRMMGSPGTDDRLLVLVKLNVFRALISNSLTLGIAPQEVMDDDAVSTFCVSKPGVKRILALPSALRPTAIQLDISHHPWIDCLPVPQMRQNLIQAGDTFDVMELCGDLVGLFSTGTGRTGIVVWGEPWNTADWEVTEGFMRTWGWTIKGCWDLFESTNLWRARRGEKSLCFENLT